MLPRASAPAGTLAPGSVPAAGWSAPTHPRLPDRGRRPSGSGPRFVVRPPGATDRTAVATAPAPAGQAGPVDDLPAPRLPVLLQGALPAVLVGIAALVSELGPVPFVLVVLLVQLVVVQSVLALVEAPAEGGSFLVAAVSLVAADAVVLLDGGRVRGFAAVTGLALVASLVHQLARRRRSRVTESIADTLVAVVLAVMVACLPALRALPDGAATVRTALVAAGVSLLAARIGDAVASRPMLAVGSTRGWPGLLLGLGAGVAAAVLVQQPGGVLVAQQAALVGLVCAATVAAGDLAVDLGAAELRAGDRDARRVGALVPAGVVLPVAMLGPIALVAGHLVLR